MIACMIFSFRGFSGFFFTLMSLTFNFFFLKKNNLVFILAANMSNFLVCSLRELSLRSTSPQFLRTTFPTLRLMVDALSLPCGILPVKKITTDSVLFHIPIPTLFLSALPLTLLILLTMFRRSGFRKFYISARASQSSSSVARPISVTTAKPLKSLREHLSALSPPMKVKPWLRRLVLLNTLSALQRLERVSRKSLSMLLVRLSW